MALLAYISLTLVGLGFVNSENATLTDDTCELERWEQGLWAALLDDWALTPPAPTDRQGRIMALPPTKGYYVTERIDGPLTPPPPPPPPQAPPDNRISPGPPMSSVPSKLPGASPPPALLRLTPAPAPGSLRTHLSPHNYNEWEPPSGGKIVNRPHSYEMFRPSYPPPGYGARPPRPAADRVDQPPRKQVSETDLYLLTAIEKLVYRVDLMEKRLRKMEDNVHYLVAGADSKPEPCAANFSRAGGGCYHWAAEALDWKGASLACRKLRAALLELPEPGQRRQFVSTVLADKQHRGNDFWTGGLNPGLLWIWSHSARPVEPNRNGTGIAGDGRCLALVHDPAVNSYAYRGRDCALPHRFVCQREEEKEKLGNEIERVARRLRSAAKRKARTLWEDDA